MVAMPKVHPTAIIDPQAKLADEVEVGPWCVIQGAVSLGAGCRVMERVSIYGPLTAGKNNVFYPNSCIGTEPQDRKFDPAHEGAGTRIGDGNMFREGVTVHRSTSAAPTTIGHRNFLMSNVHLAHDVRVGDDNVLANGTLLGGHVEIADQAFLGGNSGVHQFCRVGRLAMLSGGAGLTQDLPPFCTSYDTRQIGSLNIVGLRRAGYRAHIPNLRRAFSIFFRSGLTNQSAIGRIEEEFGHDPLCQEFAEFIKRSKRGITHYRRRGRWASIFMPEEQI
jgi:UDP-N-acetylglucosamine acyltransferase